MAIFVFLWKFWGVECWWGRLGWTNIFTESTWFRSEFCVLVTVSQAGKFLETINSRPQKASKWWWRQCSVREDRYVILNGRYEKDIDQVSSSSEMLFSSVCLQQNDTKNIEKYLLIVHFLRDVVLWPIGHKNKKAALNWWSQGAKKNMRSHIFHCNSFHERIHFV